MKLAGVSGAPEHPLGIVTTTAAVGKLLPLAFVARKDKLYVPAGTPLNVEASTNPSGSDATADPVTSSTIDVGSPPANVFFHASDSVLLLTSASRSCGAEGTDGELTKI